jgi:hypothetical protein
LRIQVFKRNQDPASENPAHTISQDLAHKICGEKLAKWLNPKAIVLRTLESMREIKKRFQAAYIPVLAIREWKQPLLLVYPHKSQESQFCYGQRLSR